MKIFFLETVQDYGGARISTVELAERLHHQHEVRMVDFDGSCTPFLDAVNQKQLKISILAKREKPFLIRAHKSRVKNLFNFAGYLFYWKRLRNALKALLVQYDPDIIVLNNAKTLSVLFGLKKRAKVIYFARGWFIPRFIPRFNKYITQKTVDQYICVSEATRHALYAGGMASLKDLFVVHNAINVNKFSNIDPLPIKKESDEIIIMHSGGFLESKGQLISLEIASKLKTLGLKFKLILAGLVYKEKISSEFLDTLKLKIQKSDLQDHVQLIINNHNIIPLIKSIDVLIHPSATEGLPRVVMEAMALRKVVIANAVGGVTDYLLHNFTGFITNFNDSDDYVKYIVQLTDKSEYERISHNSYSLITSSFTEEQQVSQFEAVFTKLYHSRS